MINNIDEFLSAKLQACAMNYDYYLCKLFGDKYSVSKELSLSIQFSAISPKQEEELLENQRLTSNVKNFIATFEKGLSDDDIMNPRYAYRILYVPINAKREGQADRVIKFVKPDSELANEIERVLIKETEKNKYTPSVIVEMMKKDGFIKFSVYHHTKLWQSRNAKDANKCYGTQVLKTWYWYDSWVEEVRKHCQENKAKYR
jgi:hypothetical protein